MPVLDSENTSGSLDPLCHDFEDPEAVPLSSELFRTPRSPRVAARPSATRSSRRRIACLFTVLLGGAGVACWLGTNRWSVSAGIGGATQLEEHGGSSADLKEEEPHSLSFCTHAEEDVEFHTKEKLYTVEDVESADMCCAECNGDPLCSAWTWGQQQGLAGVSHMCFLKRVGIDEKIQRVHRKGIVSGLVLHRLRKHGLVAELLAHEASTKGVRSNSTEHAIFPNETCPGELRVAGHGKFQVVSAQWSAPGTKAAVVNLPMEDWAVEPRLSGRAYLAGNCTAGEYNHEEYAALKLLGKTLSYKMDLSGAGCGCNAQLHLAPMRQNKEESKCKDYVCGSTDSCGAKCAEIGIQDANQFAWSSSLHAHGDAAGVAAGYGGATTTVGRRDWGDAQYGPGAECIDTAWPFEVAISFMEDDDGGLEAMEVMLSQEGRSCPLTARIDEYRAKGHSHMAEISKVLKEGVTPVMSYWSAPDTKWLDGIGADGKGPCVKDAPEACPDSVRFYDFSITKGPAKKPTKIKPGPFEVAINMIHDHTTRDAKMYHEEALANATAKELLADDEDCGDECDTIGVDMPEIGGMKVDDGESKKTRSNRSYVEKKQGNVEWEVVFSQVYIRSEKSFESKILGRKVEGQVIIGEQQGNFVELTGKHGFVAIKKHDSTFLKKRIVTYEKLPKGSCSDKGMFAIKDAKTCIAAAWSTGYFDTSVTVYHGSREKPEGCYLWHGQVWLSTNEVNKGNGAVGERYPLCSSKPYATTTTTTTTTYTTTTQTVTTTTTTTWGFPSLFCFEVMMRHSYEYGLVRRQIKEGVGIFRCDEHAVFSQDAPFSLGRGPHGPEVKAIWFKKAFVGKSEDGTAGNALLFVHVFQAIHKDGRWAHHDWTIKADPDAVVLPTRVRTHLRKATGPNNYLVNCNKFPNRPPFPMIFGAFEAYSKKSLEHFYNGGVDRCMRDLPWKRYGEDKFLGACMKELGSQGLFDFKILGDNRCTGAWCGDGVSAAYHDFKSQQSWFKCWHEAIR